MRIRPSCVLIAVLILHALFNLCKLPLIIDTSPNGTCKHTVESAAVRGRIQELQES